MINGLLIVLVALVLIGLALQVFVLFKKVKVDLSSVDQALRSVQECYERIDRSVREEIARNRVEAAETAKQSREELAAAIKDVGDSLNQQIAGLTQTNEQKLEKVRETLEQHLTAIQEDNATQLDQMRATVDEKLHDTLEKRLGESFRLVSDRLEQVHKGLGEMQALAAGVGDLKKVLTNVKTRGTWGEVQLGAMLEQILTPDQYAANIATKEGSERVEFAIKLPGRGDDKNDVIWLPIDAKFPLEDYQRLVDAQENASPEAAEEAGRQIEARIKNCAHDICNKYIAPPKTTDFAILFLPTEGLFAEVIRRVGLAEIIQRECRVVIAGPTTFWSILNSLQMGFRTLVIEKRSSEVWKVLGAVKTEFGKFGILLDGVKKKLDAASNNIESAAVRSRAIERKLRSVEALPPTETSALLTIEEGPKQYGHLTNSAEDIT